MSRAEYPGNGGCPQRDSAEHEEYAGARSADRREPEETGGADLLERIEDYDVWDFALSEEEMARMTASDKNGRFADY